MSSNHEDTHHKAKAPSQRQRIWSAIRVLKTFDIATLTMASQTSYGTATMYVSCLTRAGYLRHTTRAVPSRGIQAAYRLVRPSGRQSPVVDSRRDAEGFGRVTDPNTGKTYRIAVRRNNWVNYVR